MLLMAMFENTRTLVQLAQTSNQGDLIQKIRLEEEKFKDYLRDLVKHPKSGDTLGNLLRDYLCPTQMALVLRLECYKTEIHGATVACPVDQEEFQYPDQCSPEEFTKSILVTISPELTKGAKIKDLMLGPFRSYIGSKVVEKVVKSPMGDIPTTRTNDAARRLASLLSWSKRACSENVTKIVYQLMNDKPTSFELLAPIVVRGNIHHRLRTPFDSQGCIFKSLLHVMSHVQCSTSGMTYQVVEGDYTIFFQSLFHFAGIFLSSCASKVKLERMMLMACGCKICSRPVPHQRIEAPTILVTKPAPDQEVIPPRFTSGNAEVTLAVAVKISSSFRKHSIRSIGDTTELVEDTLPLATNLVNLSDFRRCNLERLAAYLFVRTPYMIIWCRKFKLNSHVTLLSRLLYPLADCLLRTQRLNEMVRILGMDISYEATRKANALSKQRKVVPAQTGRVC